MKKIEGLDKLGTSRYYHVPTGAIIEKKGRERRGRHGFALPGWAILVNGREVNRWSTLTRAAEEAGR